MTSYGAAGSCEPVATASGSFFSFAGGWQKIGSKSATPRPAKKIPK